MGTESIGLCYLFCCNVKKIHLNIYERACVSFFLAYVCVLFPDECAQSSPPVSTKTKPLFCSAQIVPDLCSQRNSKKQMPNMDLSNALQICMDVQIKICIHDPHLKTKWKHKAYFESL